MLDTRSLGAALWEWMNPEQVQAEYRAVGLPVPTVEQIRDQAIFDASVATGETASNIVERFKAAASEVGGGALSVGKIAAIIAVALAAIALSGRRKR